MLAKISATDYRKALVIGGGILAATLLHYRTSPSLVIWHIVFQRLYYLPIIYAAIQFGVRGGLAASLLSAACYLPHIQMAWHHINPDYAVNQYAEIIVFFLVGTVTGVLADRERQKTEQLRTTTAQLSKVYRELQESFEKLKRADRLSAIGQLSASLAHEIRNPLASIEGATTLLDAGTPTEVRSEVLGIVRKECQRLNRLLTNLLDFARPKAPEFQIVDLAKIIDSIATLAGHSAEQSGIHIRRELPASLPPLESDPEQIKQVLLNLTINAIQAMTGGGEVTITAARQDSNIVIRVRDEGPGVPPEHIEKIFDPFFTTKEHGTGLGLSVAHQIVSQHGGTITADRNVGGGMTFSVTLPLHPRREKN